MRRLLGALCATASLAAIVLLLTGTAGAIPDTFFDDEGTTAESGAVQMRDVNFGNFLTECPQAGIRDRNPKPLDKRQIDQVEHISQGGDDQRANQDYSCMPQDETSLDMNPLDQRNVVGGANDYRLGWGTSGFYASTDNGQTWYDGIIPFPSLPNGDNLDGGGDPVGRVTTGRGPSTTRTSTSTGQTTRAASGSAAPRTAASPGRGRASRSSRARRRPRTRPSAAARATRVSRVTARSASSRTTTAAERQRADPRQGVDHRRPAARRASRRRASRRSRTRRARATRRSSAPTGST